MLNTEYLIKNITKCFKNVSKDIINAVKLRQSREFNFNNFIDQLKNKVKSNFEFYFQDACKIYFDSIPSKSDHEYIAVSLDDLDNLQNGLNMFGFIILYRNLNFKLSIIYTPEQQDKIIIKNENFYKEDFSENLQIIKINKRHKKILAITYISEKTIELAKKLEINFHDILALRSQSYILYLLILGKVDLVYFNTKNLIMHSFLEHMLQNLMNNIRPIDIKFSKITKDYIAKKDDTLKAVKHNNTDNSWVFAYENGDYIINFSSSILI